MKQLLSPYAAVHYSDRYTERWIRFRSPEDWRGRAHVHYRRVPFALLQPAGSPTHFEVLSHWREMLARGEAIPSLVVSGNQDGTYYVHDGNHRYHALSDHFGEYGASLARVRVAVIEPMPGHEFAWQWFDGYGTYLLKRTEQEQPNRPAHVAGGSPELQIA